MAPTFERSVFLNCPFDAAYRPLMRAMMFAVYDCGYFARTARDDTGGGELRLDKIVRLIRASRYSIHDLSRVGRTHSLPRFNMPFEAGLAIGAIRFDTGRGRDCLILEAEPYRDQRTVGDLAGQDTVAHRNRPERLIGAVRSFLKAKSPASEMRGQAAITTRFHRFNATLPIVASHLGISMRELDSFDFTLDYGRLVFRWITENP